MTHSHAILSWMLSADFSFNLLRSNTGLNRAYVSVTLMYFEKICLFINSGGHAVPFFWRFPVHKRTGYCPTFNVARFNRATLKVGKVRVLFLRLKYLVAPS